MKDLELFFNESAFRAGLRKFAPMPVSKAFPRFKTQLLTRPEIPKDVYKLLVDVYRDDIMRLQEMVERNLSHWLEVP